MTYEHREPTEEEYATARTLVEEGWFSISRKYRIVVRLPEGMTGREALRWGMLEYQRTRTLAQRCSFVTAVGCAAVVCARRAGHSGLHMSERVARADVPEEFEPMLDEYEEQWIQALSDGMAAEHFGRVYTAYPFASHLTRELGIFEYQAFRKLGGRSGVR